MNVLVTGATGFIGRQLCVELINRGHHVSALVRNRQHIPSDIAELVSWFSISGLDDINAIKVACEGVEVVIHLAARVHQMGDTDLQEAGYNHVNCQGSLNLARAAVAAGVNRFIFLSTIKVNGEEQQRAYCASDHPNPQNAYARSKYAAEQGLQQLAEEHQFGLVVIRPPLVYGSGVKANFLQLIRWVKQGVPLPLAGINNQRSLVSVENLVDLIRVCISHPDACDEVLLVSDGESVSTGQLIERIAQAYAVKSRLFKCPESVLRLLAKFFGRTDSLARLQGSLAVDIAATCRRLDWSPPVTMQQTLAGMAELDNKKDICC